MDDSVKIVKQPKQNFHYRYESDKKDHNGFITSEDNPDEYPQIKVDLATEGHLDANGKKRNFYVLISLHSYWKRKAQTLSPHVLEKVSKAPVKYEFLFEEMQETAKNPLERYWILEKYGIRRTKKKNFKTSLESKSAHYKSLGLPLDFQLLQGDVNFEDEVSVEDSGECNVCIGFTIFEKNLQTKQYSLYRNTIYANNIFDGDDLNTELCNIKGSLAGGMFIYILGNFNKNHKYTIQFTSEKYKFNNKVPRSKIEIIRQTALKFKLPKGPGGRNVDYDGNDIEVNIKVIVGQSTYQSPDMTFCYENRGDDVLRRKLPRRNSNEQILAPNARQPNTTANNCHEVVAPNVSHVLATNEIVEANAYRLQAINLDNVANTNIPQGGEATNISGPEGHANNNNWQILRIVDDNNEQIAMVNVCASIATTSEFIPSVSVPALNGNNGNYIPSTIDNNGEYVSESVVNGVNAADIGASAGLFEGNATNSSYNQSGCGNYSHAVPEKNAYQGNSFTMANAIDNNGEYVSESVVNGVNAADIGASAGLFEGNATNSSYNQSGCGNYSHAVPEKNAYQGNSFTMANAIDNNGEYVSESVVNGVNAADIGASAGLFEGNATNSSYNQSGCGNYNHAVPETNAYQGNSFTMANAIDNNGEYVSESVVNGVNAADIGASAGLFEGNATNSSYNQSDCGNYSHAVPEKNTYQGNSFTMANAIDNNGEYVSESAVNGVYAPVVGASASPIEGNATNSSYNQSGCGNYNHAVPEINAYQGNLVNTNNVTMANAIDFSSEQISVLGVNGPYAANVAGVSASQFDGNGTLSSYNLPSGNNYHGMLPTNAFQENSLNTNNDAAMANDTELYHQGEEHILFEGLPEDQNEFIKELLRQTVSRSVAKPKSTPKKYVSRDGATSKSKGLGVIAMSTTMSNENHCIAVPNDLNGIITHILSKPESIKNIIVMDTGDEDGNTIFHKAIMAESTLLHLYRQMKTTPHKELVLKARNIYHEKLLHYACAQNTSFCIRPLVGMGCGLHEQDGQGRTPLHIAIEGEFTECIMKIQKLLVDHTKMTKTEIDERTAHTVKQLIRMFKVYNDQGFTVLHAALLANLRDLVEVMLEFCHTHKLDILSYEVLGCGDTIFHLIAKENLLDMMELVKKYVPFDVKIKNYPGQTVLDIAELSSEMSRILNISSEQ